MYRSSPLNKAIIPALAIAALAYALYATEVMRPKKRSEPPLLPPPARSFPHSVAAVGIIEPASELVEVAPRVPGWIETVHVAAGQPVEKGQPLFTLDASDLRAELALRRQALAVAERELARLRALPRPEDVPIARANLAAAQAIAQDARNNLQFIEAVTDRRAVREEDISQRRQAAARADAQAAARQAELDLLLAGAWAQDIAVSEQKVAQARAAVDRIQADIDRMTTRAPAAAIVLRLTARAGQYAPATSTEPLAILGSPGPMHVRADINEEDVPRVTAGRRAVATVRGAAATPIELEFVRFEPLVVPKRALSGFAPERVDTRVLQAIYRLRAENPAIFAGQQVDVYIEAEPTTDHTDNLSSEVKP